jgi:hypothetical protein
MTSSAAQTLVVRHYGLEWSVREDYTLLIMPLTNTYADKKCPLGTIIHSAYTGTFRAAKKEPQSAALKITTESKAVQHTFALNPDKFNYSWANAHEGIANAYRGALIDNGQGKQGFKNWSGEQAQLD